LAGLMAFCIGVQKAIDSIPDPKEKPVVKLGDASAERALRAILQWLGGIFGFVLVAANIIVLLFFGRAGDAGPGIAPQAARADALKKRPFRGNRAPRRVLVLGLAVLVGLGGYALHRANRRPSLPATGAQAWWTPTERPSSPAPAAATAAWDTVLPTASGTPQPAPSPRDADWDAAEQLAPPTGSPQGPG
jgi:hypothetical protein